MSRKDLLVTFKKLGMAFIKAAVQMSARYAHLGPGAMPEAVKRLPILTTGDQDGKGKVVKIK